MSLVILFHIDLSDLSDLYVYASDSLRPWRYINLLYLLTLMRT